MPRTASPSFPCLTRMPAPGFQRNPGQKKPRLRGVSVACLCVEECRSRCYLVPRSIRRAGRLLPDPRLFSVIPLSLGVVFLPGGCRCCLEEKQHSCQLGPLAPPDPPAPRSVSTNVTQCTLWAGHMPDAWPRSNCHNPLCRCSRQVSVKILDTFRRALSGTSGIRSDASA